MANQTDLSKVHTDTLGQMVWLKSIFYASFNLAQDGYAKHEADILNLLELGNKLADQMACEHADKAEESAGGAANG